MNSASAPTAVTRNSKASLVRRILVPTDLTDIAHHAFNVALDLARRTGGEVELLTVLGQIEGDAYSPVRYSPEAMARHESAEGMLQKQLDELIARHNTRGVTVSAATRRGRPIPSIVARAEQIEADMLVVGTHERGRFEHFLIGSAADDIVRQAPCSVLVVHEHDRQPPDGISRILVPLDLSDVSPSILRYAMDVARLYGARLDIVHVIEPIPLLDTLAGAMTIRDIVPDMRRRTVAELTALVDRVRDEKPILETHVAEGHAVTNILNEASRRRSDLIVVGRQGRSAIERFLLGSVTERVMRHAECPVLVADVAALDE